MFEKKTTTTTSKTTSQTTTTETRWGFPPLAIPAIFKAPKWVIVTVLGAIIFTYVNFETKERLSLHESAGTTISQPHTGVSPAPGTTGSDTGEHGRKQPLAGLGVGRQVQRGTCLRASPPSARPGE